MLAQGDRKAAVEAFDLGSHVLTSSGFFTLD